MSVRKVSKNPTGSHFIYLPKSWYEKSCACGWSGKDVKLTCTSKLSVEPYPSQLSTLAISKTPLRIPLGGGGTDIPDYYTKHHGGFWISGAINKYIYIMLNSRFEKESKVVYSKTEYIDQLSQISHEMLRAILSKFNLKEHIELVTMSDLPSRIGLGSSGTFTVGVLTSVYAYLNQERTAESVAEEAFEIEHGILNRKTGKQDQYAAACGGIRVYYITEHGSVTSSCIPNLSITTLEKWLSLFYVDYRTTSTSDAVLAMSDNDREKISQLTLPIFHALRDNDFLQYGELVDKHWTIKSAYQPAKFSHLIKLAQQHGAISGKLCGAGEGGCVMVVSPPEHKIEVIEALEHCNARHIPFTFTQFGSEVY